MLHDIDKSIKMTYLENIMIFKLIFNKYLQFMRHGNQIMRISEGQTLQALNESPSQIIQMMNYISKTYGNVRGLGPVGNRNSRKNIEADDKKSARMLTNSRSHLKVKH